MTPAEAFGALRVTLPDVVEGVIHDGIGMPETQVQAHAIAAKLRAAPTLDEAVKLDTQLSDLADTDPPFRQALLDRTAPVRDKAEAESPAGQVRETLHEVQNAVHTGASLAKDLGVILLVGLGLFALVEVGKVGRTLKGGLT